MTIPYHDPQPRKQSIYFTSFMFSFFQYGHQETLSCREGQATHSVKQ